MRLFKLFTLILFLLFFCQSLISCSGCSQSGMRNRVEKKSNGSLNSSYSSPKKENKSEPKLILNPKGESGSREGSSLTSLFKENKSAVFMIYTSDGEQEFQGSGFFISPDGIGISNYHVFRGTSKGLEIVRLESGRKLKIAKVLATSEEDDYIIFKVNSTEKVKFLTISEYTPEIGENVFAIGNPEALEQTLSTGIVSGYRINNKLIQTTTEITHGSSGGPLMNMQGEVVGIASAGLGEANLNFAINIKLLDLNKYKSQATATAAFQSGHSYMAHVKRVIDGDTFVLDSDERVRLIGIDTPETVHPRKEIQLFGPEASEFTKNAIEGKEVKLEFDVDLYDRYNRLLAYVYYDDVFLNEELLLNGLAVVSTYPPNVKYVDQFLSAQNQSKNSKIGIWGDEI